MRPLRLELKGFTSFRDEQQIDFEGLDLFAISGPTGSGKSSLLDAMTYALYGYAERVGKQVGQLVSQGQKRMAVAFEFEVDGERWRIERTTPASGGSTRPLLKRPDGDGWVQAGEGADRVAEVNARIKELIGLDYEGFTRSVLLPQGRFQEFLVGDPKERRRILTDLLGLELFERLAKRAGEIRRTAQAQAQAKGEMLDSEYGSVTEEAVAAEEARSRAAAEREGAFGESETAVRALVERWKAAEREATDLEECRRDLLDVADVAGECAGAFGEVAIELADAASAAEGATEGAARAAEEAAVAHEALGNAEAEWGSIASLSAARALAEQLPLARAKVDEAQSALARVREDGASVEVSVAEAADRVTASARIVEDADVVVVAAQAAFDAAGLADRAAAIRAELRPGDDCPVCGAHIEQLPHGAAPDLEHARKDLAGAKAKITEAEKAFRVAERAHADAERALAGHGETLGRLEKELETARMEVSRLEQQATAGLGGELPLDPAAELAGRIERLQALADRERETRGLAVAAERAKLEAEQRRKDAEASVTRMRDRLGAQPLQQLVRRASSFAEGIGAFPKIPPGADPAELGAAAEAVAAHAGSAAEALEEVAQRRSEGEQALVAEAVGAVGTLVDVERLGNLDQLLETVVAERQAATVEAATARGTADVLRERLGRRAALVAEIDGLIEREQRFHALALELRADRLISFLQLEALRLLAAAGSERLSGLSGGRYRLAYQDEEFSVVDVWNGEEARSARTLSGGETFLASLALALALSEQVRSLAVTERARLDSLFLDEGFGTLDPETLEVVVEAIEQLGGDGRTVGIITHVQELAIRLPARIEVEKSPRGSRLHVMT